MITREEIALIMNNRGYRVRYSYKLGFYVEIEDTMIYTPTPPIFAGVYKNGNVSEVDILNRCYQQLFGFNLKYPQVWPKDDSLT